MSNTGKTIIILSTWLMLVIVGFWWFEFRLWRSFSDPLFQFDGQGLVLPTQLQSQKGVKVVHYIDHNCYCSLKQVQHMKTLSWDDGAVNQWVVEPSSTSMHPVPATPAVAIWDENNELAYIGPYSAGGICGLGEDFVNRVVSLLRQNRNPRWINTLAKGCYCPWSNEVLNERQHVDAQTL